jgi:AraC-like DNA-binding protein
MLDPASQEHGRLVDLTTDNVAARDRFGYWRDAVLRRTRPEAVPATGPFTARLRRIVLPDVELIEHASESIVSGRASGRTRFEGGDDIAIELMRRGTSNLTHNGEHRLKAGDMWLVDYALPFRTERSRHRACGVVLSRRSVKEVFGADLSRLGGHRLYARGLGAVVRAHMTVALDEAPYMSTEQRIGAVRTLADMMLVVLQNMRFGAADPDQLGEGLYRSALAVIELHCADPDLSPERIALMVGCSRASLYRLFAIRDQGVAEAIWQARLERVHRELSTAAGVGMTIGELALQCGFSDLSSFGRMFKRRYGIGPQEARRAGCSFDATGSGRRRRRQVHFVRMSFSEAVTRSR